MHRPTWNTAKGGATLDRAKTSHISSKALAGFLKMKVRQAGQNAPADIAARDFRRELEEREAKLSKEGEMLKSQISITFSKVSDAEVASALPVIEGSWDDIPAVDGRDKDDAKLGRLASESAPNWDSSDSEDEKAGSSDSSSEEDEDSEDEDAALMRELELIKRERAAEAAEKACYFSACANAIHTQMENSKFHLNHAPLFVIGFNCDY
jgi:protein CWC15